MLCSSNSFYCISDTKFLLLAIALRAFFNYLLSAECQICTIGYGCNSCTPYLLSGDRILLLLITDPQGH
ncbi:MAG: hypothetical protein AAFQ80_11675 [Cyanobacteria bacterium J06621_8]